MEINHKFDFVEGSFDTETGKLVAVCQDKYADVSLCFKTNMNVPFAKIKLYSKDRFIDAKETMDDAYRLAKEIADRWNSHSKKADAAIIFVEKIAKLEPDGDLSAEDFKTLITVARKLIE